MRFSPTFMSSGNQTQVIRFCGEYFHLSVLPLSFLASPKTCSQIRKLGAVASTSNPSTWEGEAGELRVQGQSQLYSKFEVRLGCGPPPPQKKIPPTWANRQYPKILRKEWARMVVVDQCSMEGRAGARGGAMLASWDAQSHGPFSLASVGSEHEADQ